ncbi:hypothetical protein FRC07_000535 [Ceratobasidium sp. 392]|nr:hypothetical protein FRC07_000535 [Ceratobasidium sp. 392]
MDTLRQVPNPPPSLIRVLQTVSELRWTMPRFVPRTRRSTAHPRQAPLSDPWSVKTATLLPGVIEREVIERMYIINHAIRDRPLIEDVEILNGVPVTLSTRRARLLNLRPNDFFYDDFVQLVNRTAQPVTSASINDADIDESEMPAWSLRT